MEQGRFLGEYRRRSQQFMIDEPEGATAFPRWDVIQTGWQKVYGPMDLPETPETFGIIHSDFHTSNYMLDQLTDGSWEMTAIDFDNAQQSWYIIDLGTVVFEANKQLDANKELLGGEDAYQTLLAQFKDWIIEGYAMPVDRAELT